MGNRAMVIFHNHERTEYAPAVYLHYSGALPQYLAELAKLMEGRPNDAEYAAARFVGIVHTHMPGNLSLGIVNLGRRFRALPSQVAALYPGDQGVILVDAKSWEARYFGQKGILYIPEPEENAA